VTNRRNSRIIQIILSVFVLLFGFSLTGFTLSFPWKLEKNFEEVTGTPPFMDYPVGVVVDSAKGFFWVSDWGNNRVLAFNREGKLLKSITGLQGPVGLALSDGKLFVVEQKGNQVKVFDAEKLNLITSLKPEKSSFREPRGIWIDGAGTVYVADTGNSRIVVFGLQAGRSLLWVRKVWVTVSFTILEVLP